MTRNKPLKNCLFATLPCVFVVAVLATTVRAHPESAPPAAPPAEVQKLLDRMGGNWSAKDVVLKIHGKPMKSESQVQCEKVAAGWGLRCRVFVTTNGRRQELEQILAWDKPSGEFHLFSVSDSGDTHDHRGTFDGTSLALEYKTTRDGKPMEERVVFTARGPKELLWSDSCTLGGDVIFSGEGLYHK